MDYPQPYKGLSIDRLMAVINHDNQVQWQYGAQCVFERMWEANDGDGRNTHVMLRFNPTIQARPETLSYRRLSLDVLGELPEHWLGSVLIEYVPFTIHDILPRINQALGLDLLESEVLNTEYHTRLASYPLTIKPDASCCWKPSSFSFKAEHAVGMPLYRALREPSPNGLVHENVSFSPA